MKNFYSIRYIEYLDNGKTKGDLVQYFSNYNTAKAFFDTLCVDLKKQNTEEDGWHESLFNFSNNDYKSFTYSLRRRIKRHDDEYITVYLATEDMFETIEESWQGHKR